MIENKKVWNVFISASFQCPWLNIFTESLCVSIFLVAVLVFLVHVHFISALFTIIIIKEMNERLYPAAVHKNSFSHSLTFSLCFSSSFPLPFSRCLFPFTFFVTRASLCCLSAKFFSAERRWRRQMLLFLRVTIVEWRFQAAALLLPSACFVLFQFNLFSVSVLFYCDFSSEEGSKKLWHSCLTEYIHSSVLFLFVQLSKTQITALKSAWIATRPPEIPSS